MPRVRFTDNFDFHPRARSASDPGPVTVSYRDGQETSVVTKCADQAIKAGKAQGLDGYVPAPEPVDPPADAKAAPSEFAPHAAAAAARHASPAPLAAASDQAPAVDAAPGASSETAPAEAPSRRANRTKQD